MKKKTAVILYIVAALLAAAAAAGVIAVTLVINDTPQVQGVNEYPFLRDTEAMKNENYAEGRDEVCPVTFKSMTGDYVMAVDFTYDEWKNLPAEIGRDGDVYLFGDGSYIALDHTAFRNGDGTLDKEAVDREINRRTRAERSKEYGVWYLCPLALAVAAVAFFTAATVVKKRVKK